MRITTNINDLNFKCSDVDDYNQGVTIGKKLIGKKVADAILKILLEIELDNPVTTGLISSLLLTSSLSFIKTFHGKV